jgi:hypothetical protein
MVLWVLWYYGIMVLWYYGIVGIMVLWYCGIMVLWYYGIMVFYFVVSQNKYNLAFIFKILIYDLAKVAFIFKMSKNTRKNTIILAYDNTHILKYHNTKNND